MTQIVYETSLLNYFQNSLNYCLCISISLKCYLYHRTQGKHYMYWRYIYTIRYRCTSNAL